MTGLMFAAIAAVWLMYLVPYYLRQRGRPVGEAGEVEIPFTPQAVTVVRTGASLAEADPGVKEVSTPLTRRARLRELKLTDQLAAQRRRRVLIFLLLVQLVVAVLAVFEIGSWWAAAIPAGLLVAFLVVARFSVRAMRADLDRKAALICRGGDEATVSIMLASHDEDHEHSIELSIPLNGLGSLWEPIPITRPTYVSQPLAPRTVRTIDLAFPVAPGIPVIAESPTELGEVDRADEGGREVG